MASGQPKCILFILHYLEVYIVINNLVTFPTIFSALCECYFYMWMNFQQELAEIFRFYTVAHLTLTATISRCVSRSVSEVHWSRTDQMFKSLSEASKIGRGPSRDKTPITTKGTLYPQHCFTFSLCFPKVQSFNSCTKLALRHLKAQNSVTWLIRNQHEAEQRKEEDRGVSEWMRKGGGRGSVWVRRGLVSTLSEDWINHWGVSKLLLTRLKYITLINMFLCLLPISTSRLHRGSTRDQS